MLGLFGACFVLFFAYEYVLSLLTYSAGRLKKFVLTIFDVAAKLFYILILGVASANANKEVIQLA